MCATAIAVVGELLGGVIVYFIGQKQAQAQAQGSGSAAEPEKKAQ